jgi:hypothetical protein
VWDGVNEGPRLNYSLNDPVLSPTSHLFCSVELDREAAGLGRDRRADRASRIAKSAVERVVDQGK